MTEFEKQVTAALLASWGDNESWHPSHVIERLGPRVAAAIEAASIESERAAQQRHEGGPGKTDNWEAEALKALRGESA